MSERARGWELRVGSALLGASLVAGALALPGCNALTRALSGGPEAGAVDAHVVDRLRADCSTLLARTLRNGYSVMTPLEGEAEEMGLFEGPVREGQSVYRYYEPAETEWSDDWTSVPVEVQAVQIELSEAREILDARCGPLVEGEASDDVPRLPAEDQ